jgi:hypothetical protein
VHGITPNEAMIGRAGAKSQKNGEEKLSSLRYGTTLIEKS